VSSPPDFKGIPGAWTPEELFIASVELCHMSTFLAYAEKEDVTVRSYRSHANGVMEFIDGEFRFTRIVIFATITVCRSTVESAVHDLLREAQKHCLVANSIASIVEVNPTIVLE
jgi:organic hydroperoxide reductase OsmC/OhrA